MIVDCMINFYSGISGIWHIALAYLVVQNKDRVALIVVSWHPGWEEVETERKMAKGSSKKNCFFSCPGQLNR